MINQTQIDELISQIPPIPATLRVCQNHLEMGNLTQAAKIASNDLAFVSYMQGIINSPAYGLKSEVKDINQIFSLLGANELLSIVRSYLVLLTTPKKWQIFNIDNIKFSHLQASFLGDWSKLLAQLNIQNKDIFHSIALIPASLSLCDKIFSQHLGILGLVLRASGISYNEILKKDLNTDIFEILALIASKWNLSQNVINIVKNLANSNDTISNYITLLTTYELSKAQYANSGFEEIFEFSSNASDEQLEIFKKAVCYEG